ncbi:COX15/CtaA family protein [Flavobacteriaceae bacterium F89]|uniref:Heme A synthase n=1 Tax=Cerina litoralis TaxID=2874477 RepID=A0AAE3EUT2_9FLAO|nr:COX15/CtaA family protein [Cerina litoralis]MCG2460041.1 COX15/CtaA family protein [Cerina litoralis]
MSFIPTDSNIHDKHQRIIAYWLLTGVLMIIIQVLLGGITRLTGSGLSITDWDPIMGIVPPLNHEDWSVAFQKYQETPQFRLVNSRFTLADFQGIYFWEWFHRFWARLLGFVFIVPFVFFTVRKWFTRPMVKPMIVLFLLGGLQGFVGWIMVASGLTGSNTSVDHYKLTIHFISAMVLLCYTLWFALTLLFVERQRTYSPRLRSFTLFILFVLGIQLTYGGFMAGLHASLAAPNWPGVNGNFFPTALVGDGSWWYGLTSSRIVVQWIHRGLAYLLAVSLLIWRWKARKTDRSKPLFGFSIVPVFLVLLQFTLGVLTVLNSTSHIPVFLAVIHQFNGMLLLIALFVGLFLLRRTGATSRWPAENQ